jgi:inosose dehydratase
LKDVDAAILERLRSGELSLDAAWREGIFCPFGAGVVDFDAVLSELAGFDGWTVLEQDRVVVRVADLDAVAGVEASNLEMVERKES